jgi:VanZ family protein
VPGRAAELIDLGADLVGALCGVLVVWACGIVLSIRQPGSG